MGLFLYVRACCRRASTASTAQHIAIESALHKAEKQARADTTAINASKRTELARASVSSSIYAIIQPAVFSKRIKKSSSAWPTKHSSTQQLLADARRIAFVSNFAIINDTIQHCGSLRRSYFACACGVRVAFLELGALGICKSSLCT